MSKETLASSLSIFCIIEKEKNFIYYKKEIFFILKITK